MAAMTATAPPPARYMPGFCSRRSLWTGLGITLGVNTVIALLLWQSGRGALDEQWVYSQAIGLSIWALTNLGAAWLSRPSDPAGFPRGWRLVLLVPVTTFAGAVLGLWLGDFYAPRSAWLLTTDNPALLGKIVLMSMGVGVAMTLYFYLRGRSDHLEAELQRAKAQQAEAQLRLLESQLEPHMMFNTLANLRVLIGMDPPRAQTMLDHLIAYLRSTLAASRTDGASGQHTLATEFERLNDFLVLMAIRMGPRLQVSLNLPDALRPLPVPPLLLQPLVENAIRHGLEPHVQGGKLHVSARCTDDEGRRWLVLDVHDNGAGLNTPSPLRPPHTGSGFGLQQVRERLATAHGPQASLTLGTDADGWTLARVRIPLSVL